MRRLVVLALLIPLVALAQTKPSPEAPPKQPETKSLDIPVTVEGGCSVDADAVYLSAHDTTVTTSWVSSGGTFKIKFKKHPVKKEYPCLDSQGNGIAVFSTSPYHPSDTCHVNPKAEDTTNKYAIYWVNPLSPHKEIKCNDPAVIVADSRAPIFRIDSIGINLATVSGAALARIDKEIIIADKCRPSAIINLSQQDGTTLKWKAQSTDPNVKFTINFDKSSGAVSPCWDQPKNGTPKFDFTVGNAAPSDVCYVNQDPSAKKDGYKYTITRTDMDIQGCPWKDALINVRP
jgi:hypothetical protein